MQKKGIHLIYGAYFQRLILVDTPPDIGMDDLVVSSDVDAFVIAPDIFANLNEPFKIWIYQYMHAKSVSYIFVLVFVRIV